MLVHEMTRCNSIAMLLEAVAPGTRPADGEARGRAKRKARSAETIGVDSLLAEATPVRLFGACSRLLLVGLLISLCEARPKVALLEHARRGRWRRCALIVTIDDERLAAGQHCVRQQAAELWVLELLVVRLPAHQRLEHVHLPEAQRLGEVTVRPVGRLPHVGHGHRAGAKLVVVVDQVEVLAVEGVHARLRRLVIVPNALAGLVGCVPLLLLRLALEQVARRRDEEHRLLGVVPASDQLDLRALDVEGLDEAGVQPALAAVFGELAERLYLLLAQSHTLLQPLGRPDLLEELGLREALMGRLHIEHAIETVLIERQHRLDRAEPRVGDDDAVVAFEGLDEAKRERSRLLVPVAVLRALHCLRALKDLAAHHDAADGVADRMHLAAFVRWLTADAHEAWHVLAQPLDHGLIRVEDVACVDRLGKALEQRIPPAAHRVVLVGRLAVRWQCEARLHHLEPGLRDAKSLEAVLWPKATLKARPILTARALDWKGQEVHPCAKPLLNLAPRDEPIFVVAVTLAIIVLGKPRVGHASSERNNLVHRQEVHSVLVER
mmetsp:Transcript_39140/g.97630  ORF Transcript_39140/g.97630 Transcript_39140/m.97630 type:complete len:551 (-) Transcript_39140:188-1840(-)